MSKAKKTMRALGITGEVLSCWGNIVKERGVKLK